MHGGSIGTAFAVRRRMDSFVQDLRYGVRSLRKAPAFTAVAALTLALGIGANTALFSVDRAPRCCGRSPIREPDRIVVMVRDGRRISPLPRWRGPNFLDWTRAVQRLFSGMAAFAARQLQPHRRRRAGARARRAWSPRRCFHVLGVQPHLGPLLHATRTTAGAPRTVVLSIGLWQRRFGGDPHVLGQAITLAGDSYTVIGVLPAGFRFLTTPTSSFRWVSSGRHATPTAACTPASAWWRG